MLFLCMIFGLVTGLAQIFKYGSVDKNPFTLAYSIYVGMWSVSFLEGWKRKEVEFRFLWGSEQVDDDEGLRPQFIGKLIVTEAGREKMVYSSQTQRYILLAISAVVCVFCMACTVSAAIGAAAVRNWPVPGSTTYCQDWPEMCCKNSNGDVYPASPAGEAAVMCCGYFVNSTAHMAVDRLLDQFDATTCTDAIMAACNFDSCPEPIGGTREWLNPYGVPLSVQDTKGWCDKGLDIVPDMGASDKAFNHPCGTFVQKQNQFLSSFLNLLIIQSFGQIYEYITAKLNEMENHRSEAEWQNSLVIKNFVFQVRTHALLTTA